MLLNERCLDFDVSKDPVRPELDMAFRIASGREVYKFIYKDEVAAIVCVAYTNQIPTSINELAQLSLDHGTIAVPYTVWSYKLGFGRSIIFALIERIKKERPEVIRVVTLSPKTTTAYRFHTANGAIQIASNPESDNYEYTL